MMRRKFLPLLLVVLWIGIGQAQSKIQKPIDLVNHARKMGMDFQSINLFTLDSTTKSVDLEEKIQEYNLLDIDANLLRNLRRDRPESISLRIPVKFTNPLELELVRVDIFSSDFSVLRRSDNAVAKVDVGLHYRGVIKGDESAIAAISISEKEVMGLISWNERNVVLGRLQENNALDKHIAYDDQAVFLDREFECSTEDDGIGYKRKDLEYDSEGRSVGDCIRLYIEVDHDIHNNKGGVAGATSYTTGLLNQVITIYANENISSVVSELVIWDVPSPYSSSSSSGMLNDFKANISSINGDLGQLLSYQASGGIAAGFSGICNPNVDNSLSFSSIESSYANVPSYSWSVMVVTHEFGHLWGSRHTHACVWNGNNTAIDGCAGQTEGNCGLPGVPSQGGTIMSYCHLQSVGINFNQGFGQQPGNVIRNSVANASCTSPCGTPSCDDGIQNGDETGVDCGGACPPCPVEPTCSDGIQNGDETGVDCGGPDCPPCPVGPSCFDGEQNGEETGVDCGGPDCPPCPTCDDGVQNGEETGVDCGGPDCPPCPTCDDGVQNGEETGVDCGGPDCPPCPCEANGVTLSITFDNYPDETSWEIKSGNSVVASGGPYPSQPDGSTLIEKVCLDDACYDFVIYDSDGDGLCCQYGNGSYLLTNDSDGSILASGGDFDFSETTEFCVGVAPPPVCEIPSGLAASPSQNSAYLYWPAAAGAVSYNIRFKTENSSSWRYRSNVSPPYNYTNLASCTSYEYQVRSNCTEQTSAWSPSKIFSTTGCEGPTCKDGVQNGDETGVDCGGSCPPCRPGPTCHDGEQNGDEEGVDCGGSCPDCPSEPSCNDGVKNGDEEGVDCGGSCPDCPSEPSCNDGVQNGNETGIDCGGPDCPPCPDGGCTDRIIDFNNFNTTWGIWNDGGADCRRSTDDAPYAVGGVGAPVRLRDNSSSSMVTTDNLDLRAYNEIAVDFSYYTRKMDNSTEDFWLQISTNGGASFTTVEEWNLGDEFQNDRRYNDKVVIPGPFTSSTKLRFRCDASHNTDWVYIDNVEISGCYSVSGLVIPETRGNAYEIAEEEISPTLQLFPNPVKDELTISFMLSSSVDVQLFVTDFHGKRIRQEQFKGLQGLVDTKIDVNRYPAGIYFVHLLTPQGHVTRKFVVSKQ